MKKIAWKYEMNKIMVFKISYPNQAMIVPKTNVEQTKSNEVLPLFIPFWGLISKKFL
jgi:hypothetical protein